MRVAVCDDEEESLRLAAALLKEQCGELFGETVIHLYTENSKMLEEHARYPYDIVVMDIRMEPVDGFEAAERLSESAKPCRLIFLSSREELVFQSFRYEPVYFVRKGTRERMEPELKRALMRIRGKYLQKVFLQVMNEAGLLEKIAVADIAYVESSRNYLLYHSVSGKSYRQRKTMEEEERSLSQYGFLRIHRAYLVNLSQIAQMRSNAGQIRLRSGELLPVGKAYRQRLQEKFGEEGIV